MTALLTKAFETWVAECAASNLPARPDAIVFAMMEREPTRDDITIPEEKITYITNELIYGQIDTNNIVCSAVVPDDCEFSYDWICLIHQDSGILCGVIKTPVRQKITGESLIRNFTITYSGIAQTAHITVPPQSWQIDILPELNQKAPLDSPAFTGTPTTPTPPLTASGNEMANAEFVRALIAEKPVVLFSTDSVIPLVINNTRLQSCRRAYEPVIINSIRFQSCRQIKSNDPIIIGDIRLHSCRKIKSNDPIIIGSIRLHSCRRTYEPVLIKRIGLVFAKVSPVINE